MKGLKLSLLAIFLVVCSIVYSQDTTNIEVPQEHQTTYTYRLYPTENMWTFIKLNTRNGQMWQVQYYVGGEDRFQSILNEIPLVNEESEVNGRFTLYPTENIYTFILLDQIDGRVWQTQWSIEAEYRGIIPID